MDLIFRLFGSGQLLAEGAAIGHVASGRIYVAGHTVTLTGLANGVADRAICLVVPLEATANLPIEAPTEVTDGATVTMVWEGPVVSFNIMQDLDPE